jgi:uncharacterized Zn finger protein
MASTNQRSDGTEEHCPDCGRTQPHEVAIRICTESSKEHNAEFSREPYRITECLVCGVVTKTRMNDV